MCYFPLLTNEIKNEKKEKCLLDLPVLLLSSGIEDVQKGHFIVDHTLLAIGVYI